MEAQNIEYELPTEYVNTTPGDPIRLFRFGPLFKGGKMRELTRALLEKFKLPHYKPPIKLGAHDDDAPAGGHITGLEIREDGLYGLTEYTPQGIQAIEAGNYRYHSPEVIWDGALENPDTGESIPGPLIVGTALLHTPHLGESAALYGIEPHYDGGADMTDTVQVPASFLDRLMARFDSGQEPDPEPEPAPVAGVEVEQFAALEAERDEMAAKIATMEAEQAKAGRIAHFAAELNDTVLEDDADIHELLAGVGEEAAEALLTKFKALSAQIVESNLTGDVGSAGDPDTNPHDALNAAIQAKVKEAGVAYQDAFAMVRDEQPDLFAHLKGGR